MTASKIVLNAASGVGGAGLDVNEVFHTEVYDGNGTNNIRTTGIDIATEGGLLWFKTRTGSTATNHCLIDTERPDTGSGYPYLQTNSTAGNELGESPFYAGSGYEPTTTGYKLGQTDQANKNGQTYVNWTFRKAPKFFDVVTFTGTGSSLTEIPHNLGVAPGMIIIKRTNSTSDWGVWHRGNGSTDYTGLSLNASSSSAQINPGSEQYFTDTYFRPTYVYDDTNTTMNVNGGTYVAYLFAHNDGDGNFGPDADQDIIKCGSYIGTSSSNAVNNIDLGFEPQWLLIKGADYATSWHIFDNMRGIVSPSPIGSNDAQIYADTSAAEVQTGKMNGLTATGFAPTSASFDTNYQGKTYMYIAIRRGPMAVPESATDVFAIDTSVNASFPRFTSNFPVDFAISTTTNAGDPRAASSRLTSGKWMRTNGTNAESNNSAYVFDSNDGYFDSTLTNGLAWMWRRAPSFFDVVAYTGTGNNSTRMVDHNLTVKPEMVWVKRRDDISQWFVTTESLGVNNYLNLENSGTGSTYTNMGAHTATQFSARGQDSNNGNFIAYLFASLDGISKVGSYTGNGSSQTIDCGFSSGARFVLIKQTDTNNTSWFVFDSNRGIVSGNDSALRLNTTDAAATNEDAIDPVSSGFSVTNSGGSIDTNNSGGTYIFYAIA